MFAGLPVSEQVHEGAGPGDLWYLPVPDAGRKDPILAIARCVMPRPVHVKWLDELPEFELLMFKEPSFTYSVNDFLNCGVEFPHYLFNRNGNGRWLRYDYDAGEFVEIQEKL